MGTWRTVEDLAREVGLSPSDAWRVVLATLQREHVRYVSTAAGSAAVLAPDGKVCLNAAAVLALLGPLVSEAARLSGQAPLTSLTPSLAYARRARAMAPVLAPR